jgi:hypothetical protein
MKFLFVATTAITGLGLNWYLRANRSMRNRIPSPTSAWWE